MNTRSKIMLLLCGFLCVPRPGLANETLTAALADQDLAATVAGASITVALHSAAQNYQTMTGDVGSGALDRSGIQTTRADSGEASISQAATFIAVRATLVMAPQVHPGF